MRIILTTAFALSMLAPLISSAHHSVFGRFDPDIITEVEGVVTEIRWMNPHTRIALQSTGEDGDVVTWEIETSALTQLQRSGIPRDAIRAGDSVTVAGFSPVTSRREVYATNVLTQRGEELLLGSKAEPRFAEERIGDYSNVLRTEGDTSDPERGLFRVWGHTYVIPFLFPETDDRGYDVNRYPMTELARAALADFDWVRDNPTGNCTPKGMPMIMEQPLPMEFELLEDDDIELRLEEYDTRRLIHMNRGTAPENSPASPLGHSLGRWDESTLVVTTTNISWPWFNQLGIPQSQQTVLVERFTPTEDGSRLNYELTITDPVNFTESVILERYWLYVPDIEVLPYNCTEGNQ